MGVVIKEPLKNYSLNISYSGKSLFSRIGVIGCGREGQNIVRIAAWYGVEVVFIELSEERIQDSLLSISKELDVHIENWGLTSGEKRAILSRVTGSVDYSALEGCEFVVECIGNSKSEKEDIAVRKVIFKSVEGVVSKEAIIASNSTIVNITEFSTALNYPDRCLSIHFFVNSPEARIVEVVKGIYTNQITYEKVKLFVKLLNREVIPVEESSGLISVRLFSILLNEACETFMEGISSISDIDKTLRIGMGLRRGPFQMADSVGLEKVEHWMETLYAEFGGSKYKTSPVIRRLVRAKKLGVDSGEGFYSYETDGRITPEDIKG